MKDNVSRTAISDSVTQRASGHQARSVQGILQARILQWVAISRSPEDLPDLEIEPSSLTLQAYSLLSEPQGIAIVPKTMKKQGRL